MTSTNFTTFGTFSGGENSENITNQNVTISFPIARSQSRGINKNENGVTFRLPTLETRPIQIILNIPIKVTDAGTNAILRIIADDGNVILTRNVNCTANNSVKVNQIFRGSIFTYKNTISVSIEVSGSSNIILGFARTITFLE